MRPGVEFGIVFAVTLVTAALVTFLWNTIANADRTVNWEISFLFAVSFGILQTWVKWREAKEK